MMILKHALPLLVFSSVFTLSGCAESQTMGGKVGQGVTSFVTDLASGMKEGLISPVGSNQ